MKRKKLLFTLLTVSVLFIFTLSACGGNNNGGSDATNNKAPAKITRISIGTGGTGGVYYPLGGGMATIINKYVPNTEATAEVTGASIENNRLCSQNEIQFGISNADTHYFAYKGMPPFEAPQNVLAIASLYPSTMQIVVLNKSNIKTIDDLKGKRVAVGPPGGATRIMAENILSVYGIKPEDVKEFDISFSESVEAMKNNNLEATFILAGVPASSVMDISTTNDIRFLAISDDKREEIIKQFPYYSKLDIPANVYTNKEDIKSIGVMNVLLCNKDLSETLVYDVSKAIFEHLDELVAIHNIAAQITLENAPDISVPLHPGASKYFKEKGVLK